ncbi:MAG: hypothetical protein PHG83_01255 [Patescibacteria group bacterium]|nr:hypothetical protein [Patescibacteria group bacterium]
METKEQKIKRFNKHLNSIPLEVLLTKNEEQAVQNEKDFQNLKEALAHDKCSFCGNLLSHFSVYKPCFHWLLWKAKGLRKKHFSILFKQKGFHEIEAYLRWVANCDVPIKNINDLVEEKSSNKFIETTIRYKNIEWSFSCSYGDFHGHKDKHEGIMPHYHFQMKISSNVVINYNGFHIPFNDYDEFCFNVEDGEFDRLRAGHIHGAGMQTLFENLSPEELINGMRKSDDESNAQFDVSTLIEADEGTTISGDDIASMFQESKKTGIPMSKLIQKLKNVKTQTFISPGPGVPEIAARKKNRRNKIVANSKVG